MAMVAIGAAIVGGDGEAQVLAWALRRLLAIGEGDIPATTTMPATHRSTTIRQVMRVLATADAPVRANRQLAVMA
jgi:hypothetical protein